MKRLKAGEESEGGSSDQWGQMQSTFGRGGGLDICLVEKETLAFAQGHLGDLRLALAPESQAAPPLFFFLRNLPDVKPVSNFILREEFHRRPGLWPHPVAQWGSCEQQRVTFLLGCWQLTALGTAPSLGWVGELKTHRSRGVAHCRVRHSTCPPDTSAHSSLVVQHCCCWAPHWPSWNRPVTPPWGR